MPLVQGEQDRLLSLRYDFLLCDNSIDVPVVEAVTLLKGVEEGLDDVVEIGELA